MGATRTTRIIVTAAAVSVLTVIFSVPEVSASITIIVNHGPFVDVRQAAEAENRVNWRDGDYSDDRACTECFAATELASFLPRTTGIAPDDIRFRQPSSIPADSDVIIIGCAASNKLVSTIPADGDSKLETPESYRIAAAASNGRTVTVIEGGDRVGIMYGVYAYLEELGMRFYGLGEQGTVYPDTSTPLPRNLNHIVNPSFLTRGFHAWEDRGNDDFLLWMARNRMNFWTAAEQETGLCKKLGMKLADGGHVMMMHFLNARHEYPYNHPSFKGDEGKPKDPYRTGREYLGDTDNDGKLTYFEAHPEWFGLKKGKRSDNTVDEFGDNFCTSNPDARAEIAKNLVNSLIDGHYRNVDILNFWLMDDSGRWCECPECAKIGNETDRLLQVVNDILVEIGKARREKRLSRRVELSSLAYLETITPPSRPLPRDFDYDNFSITFFPIERCYDHALADPSCTILNRRLCDNYLAWVTGDGRQYRGSMFIGEYYNISYLKSLPMLYTRMMAAEIPWYHRTGANHFHYMHTPTRLWGTWTLNQYLLGRLLWDVDADADAIVAEYFAGFYPTTSETTAAFYRELEAACAGFKAMRYWGWKNGWKDTDPSKPLVFAHGHNYYETRHPLTNDGADIVEMTEGFARARRALDAALASCRDETERARLVEDERRFAYGELMAGFHYHLYRTASFYRNGSAEPARLEFGKLDRIAGQLKEITDLVGVSSSHANASDGLDATMAADLVEFFRETYGK